MRIYINRIVNRITFKKQKWIVIEISMPQIMKLFVSSENRIAKDKNGEKLP